jgi:hypothetical protein
MSGIAGYACFNILPTSMLWLGYSVFGLKLPCYCTCTYSTCKLSLEVVDLGVYVICFNLEKSGYQKWTEMPD